MMNTDDTAEKVQLIDWDAVGRDLDPETLRENYNVEYLAGQASLHNEVFIAEFDNRPPGQRLSYEARMARLTYLAYKGASRLNVEELNLD